VRGIGEQCPSYISESPLNPGTLNYAIFPSPLEAERVSFRENPMKVEQISVFLENKAGRLAEVTRVLGEAGINIRALSLADTTDFGILRLIVDQYDRAREILKEKGFTVGKTEVVAVEVPDHPGGLGLVLQILADSGVNVEYMYAFVQHSGKNAVIIFRFDNLEQAIELLQKKGIYIYKGEEVYRL
jgi:hypothetical protein